MDRPPSSGAGKGEVAVMALPSPALSFGSACGFPTNGSFPVKTVRGEGKEMREKTEREKNGEKTIVPVRSCQEESERK